MGTPERSLTSFEMTELWFAMEMPRLSFRAQREIFLLPTAKVFWALLSRR